jgi:hypothetical protein
VYAPRRRCRLGDDHRALRPDGAHVDQQQTWPSVHENALLAEHHLLDVGRIRQHGDQDI